VSRELGADWQKELCKTETRRKDTGTEGDSVEEAYCKL
jgi:hypothetical protein